MTSLEIINGQSGLVVANYVLDTENNTDVEILGNGELIVLYNGLVMKRVVEYPFILPNKAIDKWSYITVVNPKEEGYKIYNKASEKEREISLNRFSLKERKNGIGEFKWLVLFFVLTNLVLVKKLFPGVYSYIKSTNLSSDYFISSSKISNASLSPFLISLTAYLLSAVFCGLIITMQVTSYDGEYTIGAFFMLFFSFLFFLIAKNLFTLFLFYLFELKNIKLYSLVHAKITFLVFFGVFLIYLMLPKGFIGITLSQFILLVLSFFSFAVVWSAIFIFKTERFRIGYLISYICTSEILPILFLYHLLTFNR